MKELTLPIPTDLLNQMGWDIGDNLVWEESMPGTSYTLPSPDNWGAPVAPQTVCECMAHGAEQLTHSMKNVMLRQGGSLNYILSS